MNEANNPNKVVKLRSEAKPQISVRLQDSDPTEHTICLEPSTMSYQEFVAKTQEALGKVENNVSQEKVKQSVKLLMS